MKDGYGYKIYQNDKVLIYQPYIPTISEKRFFETEEDAYKTGSIVLKHLREGKNASVTKEELRGIGIK